MTNPFEKQDGTYKVLINEEGQHSLWPAFLHIPEGWSTIYGEESKKTVWTISMQIGSIFNLKV